MSEENTQQSGGGGTDSNVLSLPNQSAAAATQPARDLSDKKDESSKTIYDAEATNRFEYEVEGGAEIAHVFGPLSDERYMQWNRDLKVKGNQDDVSEEAREASVRLYDEIIVAVENIDYPEGADWKALLDSKYKIEALNDFLAVAIVEPESEAKGKLKLGGENDTQTITTECWFNGVAVQQTHVLKKRSFELEKKFDRIQAKRIKQETTRGLRRQPKVEYVPQDDKLGGLYDEMRISTQGFGDAASELAETAKIPLRFKVLVMTYVFGTKSRAKNLGK